ncbi:hypothetical protein GLYMA_12G040400v4 [Glycine max]|uniref:Uncharacterized protein n=1 Tax=Glycine max TaxID=3847 RepID=K7LSX6_SOYBN|nr:U-box domain-containing protein 44 isoform X3 [Glycine max]KRH24422.1 hypothetical protein GLYMA_12G040400v4 [Glycine max]|eukprot:XP_014619961.1 U-box domain-containing protein 44 isoform X3 [Glycine max]
MKEKRDFSEFVSELIVLADEVASFAKNPEIEIVEDAFTEFAMLVEKFAPIFNDLRDKSKIMDKSAIRKSLESLMNELTRAKALIRSSSLKERIKRIEDIAHDLGRSLGMLRVASLEVSIDFREKIGTLQKKLMNVRFGGNTSLTSSSISTFVNEEKVGGEIEEEINNVTGDDVLLHLKNGDAEEFAVALLRLKKFIRGGKLDSGLINVEAAVSILFNRLFSCKTGNRLTIIQLLRSVALQNDEMKEKMTKNELLSAVVKSLTRDTEERRESVGLLLELSDLPAVRRKIGRIQGCIVMLVSILNGVDPVASRDAAKLLDILSNNTQNALLMAEAGYFGPLVQYLNKAGSDMTKILMATTLSRLVLTDHSKLTLGQDGAIEPLVRMFNSGKLESKLSALNALQNLSSLTENVERLVKTGIVGSLLQLLFSVTSVLMTLREPASVILARIAESETVLVNKGVAQQMLSLLNLSSPVIQGHLLEALNSIASHPCASKVRSKMKDKGALQLILPLLKETKMKIRSKALNLLYTLSEDLTDELTAHFDETHLFDIVNIVLSSTSDSEKAAAVGILSNLPVSDKKVTDVLKRANLLPVLVSIMDSGTRSNSPAKSILMESIAGVAIRFTSSSDKKLQLLSAQHGVIPLLVKLLSSGSAITKFKAATALAQLSQNSPSLRRSRKSRWLCVAPSVNAYCEVHDGYCFVSSTFCLIKAGAVSPLIQILEDKDWEAVEAALNALSTLLQDEIWEGGANYIAKLSGVEAIVNVLEAGDVKVQEKALWMLERIFRIEEHRMKYAEFAQMVLIDMAQRSDSRLKSTVAKVLAVLELLLVQSSYF